MQNSNRKIKCQEIGFCVLREENRAGEGFASVQCKFDPSHIVSGLETHFPKIKKYFPRQPQS